MSLRLASGPGGEARRPKLVNFKPSPKDWEVIDALRDHTGLQSLSDLLRQALRALAQQRGLSVKRS